MAFLLAKKIAMSQRYEGDAAVPVTVLSVTPCVVTQVRTVERDGYRAVQIACGERRHVSKALAGHFAVAGKAHARFRHVREFRELPGGGKALEVGDAFDVSVLKPGDHVIVSSTSKGKGFAGVVKRHRFHGQDATHGTKDQIRMPGSIGGGGRSGGRVVKGMRMAGRMGGTRVTVKNVRVVAVDPATGNLELTGAIPGARGTLVEVRSYAGYWA